MLRRLSSSVTGVILLLAAAATSASRHPGGESPVRFVQTASRAVTGKYEVRWLDNYNATAVDDGPLPSLTWYYATRPDGSDRKRMTTYFRDDFRNGYRRNWRPEQPNVFEWKVFKEEGKGNFFAGLDAGPAVSEFGSDETAPKDIVISALVRPRGKGQEFALGGRVRPGGIGYAIRGAGDTLRVVVGGNQKPLRHHRCPQLASPTGWYWYELGVRTRKKKEVEIRVRVFDEAREKMLVCFPIEHRPQNGDLLKGGRISLWGHADFREIVVDPWAARWIEDDENRFDWDTSQVRDGDYYLVAELVDLKGARRVVSPFKVEVRNPGRADSD